MVEYIAKHRNGDSIKLSWIKSQPTYASIFYGSVDGESGTGRDLKPAIFNIAPFARFFEHASGNMLYDMRAKGLTCPSNKWNSRSTAWRCTCSKLWHSSDFHRQQGLKCSTSPKLAAPLKSSAKTSHKQFLDSKSLVRIPELGSAASRL